MKKKITIEAGGPYKVKGDIPLVRKTQIVSEYGEPLNWEKGETLKTEGYYELCRCGHSKDKPYCDKSHFEIDFEGKESASTDTFKDREIVEDSGVGIVVKWDPSLCMNSGFCANRNTNIEEMLTRTAEPSVRAEIMGMIDRCPSGTYTYALTKEGQDVEADLPVEIATTTEITSEGPIEGSYWVTGGVEIERADQKPFETRNRVTLCNCGQSSIKPLCDGTHRTTQERDLRKKRLARE